MFFWKKYLKLEVAKGPGQGRKRVLENGCLTIGSGEREADFRLAGRRIQPSHLYIEVNDGVPTLFNQATGSTRVQKKGERSVAVVQPVTLAAGDSIQIGDETLINVLRSDAKVAKDDKASGDSKGGMSKSNKNMITYAGVILLYSGGAWFFLVYEPERRAASAVSWMSAGMVDACARNALDYARRANLVDIPAPSTDDLDLDPADKWLNVMVRPDDPWRVIVSTWSSSSDKARARAELVDALKIQLDRGEVLARRGDWDAALQTYEMIDAMVPSAPVKAASPTQASDDGSPAQGPTCDIRLKTQQRLDMINRMTARP